MRRRLLSLIGHAIFPLVEGSSTVERVGDNAHKTYHPRIFVRWLHWLSFGTLIHLYETEDGLNLAYLRRFILAKVLEVKGEGRYRVAQPLEVICKEGRTALVSQWIEGRQPTPEGAFAPALALEKILAEVGLPTWSVSPKNPRFHTNFIYRDGVWIVVDFESLLLSPLINDWVDFSKLWRFCLENGLYGEDDGQDVFTETIQTCQELQERMRRRLRWDLSGNLLTQGF